MTAGDETARLRRELDRAQRIAEASYALHTTLDVDELLGVILECAKGGVDADRGTVFLLTEDRTELWSRVLTGAGDLEIRLPVGQGFAGMTAQTGESVRVRDAYADPRFDPSWDERSGYITRQILSAPIRRRDGDVVGVFQLLNKRHGEFDDEDEAFLDGLSVHVALAVENARLHRSAIEKERQDREIRLVQNVQRAFQPERMDEVEGLLHVAGLNQLCEDASGDYYDVIRLESGRLLIVIGDVSGHGLQAALVMAQARAFLRAFAGRVDSLTEVMHLLNANLARDMTEGRFMTLFLAIADPATGRLEWSNAGHPPALLLRAATGEIEELEAAGPVLGILPQATYGETTPVVLEPDDVMLLYTDGATEARRPDGDLLDEERLTDVFRGLSSLGAQGILDGIRAALTEWTGEETFGDDLTMVVLRRAGESS